MSKKIIEKDYSAEIVHKNVVKYDCAFKSIFMHESR